MGLASWRGERTASVGLREEGWVDFGASARREDGKQDGGDALELTVRVNEDPKPEVMRQAARRLVSEAREALESAARGGEQPPAWVQAFMSPAGWERYHHLRKEAADRDQIIAASPEPGPPIEGVGGSCMEQIRELDLIRDYGRAHEWAALLIDGEEIIPSGRADWLDFVWLSHYPEQQRRVYEWINSQSRLS